MQALIILISLFHITSPYSYSAIHDESVLWVLFGNVTEMRDLFIPRLDEVSSGEESSIEEEDDMPDVKRYFEETKTEEPQDEGYNHTIYNHDITEFNTISKLLNNLNVEPERQYRRQKKPANFHKTHDYEDTEDIEAEKKLKMLKIMLSLVIHVRFKVDMAVRQRRLARHTKSYRMGYLFSRLRRLKYNMAKACNEAVRANYERHNPKKNISLLIYNHVDAMLRWYEKAVRLDVDIRNIVDLVIEVANEVNPSTTTVSDY